MPRPIPQTSLYQQRWTEDDYRRRPKDFDPEIAQQIIDRVMNGETLNALCNNNRDYPLPGTFLTWLELEPSFAVKYKQAKAIQAEVLMDGILEDGKSGTWDAQTRVRAGQIYAEKTSPEKYGSRAMLIEQKKPEELPIDPTAELRKKINSMAERARERTKEPGGEAR